MNMRILTAHAGEIALSPILPTELKLLQIPESVCYGASGPFGHVLIQELDVGGISIRYSNLHFTHDEQITYISDEPALRLQIILRNSYYYELSGLGKGVLHERGISLTYVPSVNMTLKLRKQETHSHVAIYYSTEHVQTLQNSFAGLRSFLQTVQLGSPTQFNKFYTIADAKILSLINDMLDSQLSGRLRKIYLGSLAMEVLILALIKITENRSDANSPISEAEVERIYKVKELLLQDMSQEFSLPDIATRVGLSAYKLNTGFKAIYGIGVMDYLLEARMEKAHQVLLETDIPISTVVKDSGYTHPHAFSLAFKKHFGYTPVFVQKSGKRSGNRSSSEREH